MRATLLICKETRRKLREPCQSKTLCTKDGGNRKKYKADLDQQGVQSGWLKEMVVNYNKITIEEEVEDLRNHLKGRKDQDQEDKTLKEAIQTSEQSEASEAPAAAAPRPEEMDIQHG